MVRPASFDRNGMKRGAWSEEEDNKLRACINRYGHSNWRLLPFAAGLKRCGKSCRLRWVNYLKPGVRRGNFTKDEEALIIQLHNQLGNKWSAIAAFFPARTDNDIKNYWHAHIQKRSARNRAIEIQNLQVKEEEESSDNDSSITTCLNQETPAAAAFNQAAENIGVFESNADSVYNQTRSDSIDHHNNFVEEESYGVGGSWWDEDITSMLCAFSDWEFASQNLSDADFLTETVDEEELFKKFFGENYVQI